MKETIYDRIDMMEGRATKQEKVIIEFIRSHHPKDMVLLSITEFSEQAGVGDATMLRFCRKLGLKGYSEFRFLLSQSGNVPPDTEENDAGKILDQMTTALGSTYDLLDMKEMEKAANLILNAQKVFAFGSGNSGTAALELSNKIIRYGINCVYREDSHFQIIAASLLSDKDVMILFSVSGGTRDMLELARLASRQGVKLVIITNYLKSPLARYADALLYVVARSAPLNSGSLITKVSQLYIIDVLSRELYRQMGNEAEENLEKTALAVMGKEV